MTNQGSGNAGSSTTIFYLSTDGVAKGTSLGSRNVGPLSGGANSGSVNTSLALPTTQHGTFYVLACADYLNVVAETDETNNCAKSQSTMLIP